MVVGIEEAKEEAIESVLGLGPGGKGSVFGPVAAPPEAEVRGS